MYACIEHVIVSQLAYVYIYIPIVYAIPSSRKVAALLAFWNFLRVGPGFGFRGDGCPGGERATDGPPSKSRPTPAEGETSTDPDPPRTELFESGNVVSSTGPLESVAEAIEKGFKLQLRPIGKGPPTKTTTTKTRSLVKTTSNSNCFSTAVGT